MKKLILIAISAMFLASCEKEIEFNGEQTDPRLVINSIVEPGLPVSARIGKSIFFLDTDNDMQAPDDLVATLYVNGSLLGVMDIVFDSIAEHYYTDDFEDSIGYKLVKRFQSDYRPSVGDVIKITASAHGFEDVEGTSSALPKVVDCLLADKTVQELESEYQPIDDEDSLLYIYGRMELFVEVTDPNPGQTDLFRLSIQSDAYEGSENQYYTSQYYVSHEYTDPIFGGSIESNDFIDFSELDVRPEGVFSDALFDGGSYRIKVPIYFNLHKLKHTDPGFFQVPIKIEHLSKEYYYYLSTCEQGSTLTGFFSEPIQVYSNVTNGYGIVGSCATSQCLLPLPLDAK
ncbi:MAG: DUF4249 domain-containing protein [Bacteroidales bacterium]|nr:DUF4249 domain-containing protein [Bacteroidales bacterium]